MPQARGTTILLAIALVPRLFLNGSANAYAASIFFEHFRRDKSLFGAFTASGAVIHALT